MKFQLLICILATAYSWSYQNQEAWPDTCKEKKQSPVDLDTDADDVDSDFKMKMVLLGETTSRTIYNTGNMIRVEGYLGYIEVGEDEDKRAFNAKRIEFHVPSEHLIDGVRHPMEMHVVMDVQDKYMERDEANMAILCVIYKAGVESYFLNSLEVWDLPSANTNKELPATSNINVREEVWATDEYYFYKGSATHPDDDCRGDVLWYVVEQIKEASDWQIQAFNELFLNGNNRDVNTDYNPTVYYSGSPGILLAWALTLVIL